MGNKIAIYHHLGMGDAIECNGMVRHYAESYDQVDIFSQSRNHGACEFMYRDSDKIKVHKFSNGSQSHSEIGKFLSKYDGNILIPGHHKYFSRLREWEKRGFGPAEAFYYIAGVPWAYRNEKFFFQRDKKEEERVIEKLNPSREKFIFIHDDESRGFRINVDSDYKIIKNDPSENIFNMLGILELAEEVHCMSSSFLCLIDCLDNKINIKKKFLHKSIRNVELGPNGLLSKWEIVE